MRICYISYFSGRLLPCLSSRLLVNLKQQQQRQQQQLLLVLVLVLLLLLVVVKLKDTWETQVVTVLILIF